MLYMIETTKNEFNERLESADVYFGRDHTGYEAGCLMCEQDQFIMRMFNMINRECHEKKYAVKRAFFGCLLNSVETIEKYLLQYNDTGDRDNMKYEIKANRKGVNETLIVNGTMYEKVQMIRDDGTILKQETVIDIAHDNVNMPLNQKKNTNPNRFKKY